MSRLLDLGFACARLLARVSLPHHSFVFLQRRVRFRFFRVGPYESHTNLQLRLAQRPRRELSSRQTAYLPGTRARTFLSAEASGRISASAYSGVAADRNVRAPAWWYY